MKSEGIFKACLADCVAEHKRSVLYKISIRPAGIFGKIRHIRNSQWCFAFRGVASSISVGVLPCVIRLNQLKDQP